MSPLIAIPSRRVADSRVGIPVIGIRASYVEALIAVGATPVPIVLGLEEGAIADILSRCGGVLLTGGEDVHPKEYGETPHPRLGEVSEERDALELFVAKLAMREKKPLLAICRGVQLLNVACGGTLFQDLPSQCPSDISHTVDNLPGSWDSCSHELAIVPETKLSAILGGGPTIGVNSMHHQAIKALGRGLRISGTAPDGVIEAVEGVEKHFLVGVQSHPETLWNGVEPRWRRLFEAFVLAATET